MIARLAQRPLPGAGCRHPVHFISTALPAVGCWRLQVQRAKTVAEALLADTERQLTANQAEAQAQVAAAQKQLLAANARIELQRKAEQRLQVEKAAALEEAAEARQEVVRATQCLAEEENAHDDTRQRADVALCAARDQVTGQPAGSF